MKLKIPLSATLLLSDSAPPNLISSEWFYKLQCVSVLQPMEKITSTLSGELFPTLSSIIPLIRGLQNCVRNKSPNTEAGKYLQKSLLDVINKRLGFFECNKTAAKATLLDPRYKTKSFGAERNAEKATEYILEELAKYQ